MGFFGSKDYEKLKKKSFPDEAVLYACKGDLTPNGEFADFYLLLTQKELILVLGETLVPQKVYGGYIGKYKPAQPSYEGYDLRRFPMEEVEEVCLQFFLSGGLVYAKTVQGGQPLFCVTGGFTGEAKRFAALFKKAKKGEEITPDDVKEKDGGDFCEKCGAPYLDKERKICPKCTDHRSLFVRTLSYFKPHKWKMVLVTLFILLSAAFNVIMPYLSGTMYFDQVLGKKSTFTGVWSLAAGDFVVLLLLVMGAWFVARVATYVVNVFQLILVGKIVPRVVRKIKEDVFAALRRLSLSFFTDRKTGGLMTRVLGDAGEVTGFFIDGLPYVLGNAAQGVALVIMMFALNWQLAVLAVSVVPIVTFISNKLRPMLWHLHGKRHRASRNMSGVLNDTLTGARVIKAFGQEPSAITDFEKENNNMQETEVSVVAYENRFFALSSVGGNLLNVGVWALGSYLIILGGHTDMSYGMLAAFLAYVAMLSGTLTAMTDLFRWGTSSMNAAGRIFEIVDAKAGVEEKQNSVSLPAIRGDVSLKNVTFSYQVGTPVLHNVSVDVPAGQMLGIVGKSGVGKSTLVSLIARLYDADSGEITIDGIPIKELSMETLHRCISTVSQDSYVFMGTVAQNIAYAKPEATPEEIVNAAMSAGAHDFICKMPDGYETLIGSSGRQLSGGERQRLSVARAILANSPILILDEATASVDTATEKRIQTALNQLVKGRTTISIAHRLSTLRGADKLLVMDGGKVAEYGTHEELMNKQGIYYKLVELQTKALSLQGKREAENQNIMIE